MEALLSSQGIYFLMKWTHFMAGIAWIGHLYYFNFVQGAFFAEIDGPTKNQAISKLVPKALWWFRYGALFTFLSGLIMLHLAGMQQGGHAVAFVQPWGVKILLGSLLGTLMFLNVWLIIWPNQKKVIASANAVIGGQPALPEAAAAGARALLASRTNVCFSIPMLFFMGAARNLPDIFTEGQSLMTFWAVALVLVLGLEVNAIKGKLGPLTTVKGVITSGFVLTAVLYTLIKVLA